VNTSDQTLSVPLSYSLLNSIYSITGEATPPEDFAPGSGGFAVPERYFIKPDATLAGVWNFLGQQVVLGENPNTCTDRGIPGECQAIDPTTLKIPFMHARAVIVRLARQAVIEARRGRWRGTNGSYKIPFFTRGIRALASIDAAVNIKTGSAFTCPTTPPSCTLRKVNRARARSAFRYIFKGTPPRGLEHLYRGVERDAKAFEQELRKVPAEYVVCQ